MRPYVALFALILASSPASGFSGAAEKEPAPRAEQLEEPIAVPDDVAAAPKDAQKTESGLAWKVLMPGAGDKRAGPPPASL